MEASRVEVLADPAFEQLYRRHAREVYQYALALLGNPADAEDVTQTTFLNAYRAFSRGERPRKPHNWLISIAHNVCRMRWRQAGARPREVALEDVPEPTAVEHERPDLDMVLRALARLSLNQRAALVMRELEGRSYHEIAEVLGVSVSAVEGLLFRARRQLQLHRKSLGVLTTVPLPGSLSSYLGGAGGGAAGAGAGTGSFAGGAAAGGGLVLKAAVVVTAGVVAAGVGYKTTGAAPEVAAPQAQHAVAATSQQRPAGKVHRASTGRAAVSLARSVRPRALPATAGTASGRNTAAGNATAAAGTPSAVAQPASGPAAAVTAAVSPVTTTVGAATSALPPVTSTVAAVTQAPPVAPPLPQLPEVPPLPPTPPLPGGADPPTLPPPLGK